jgi:hypothetical protein
MDEALRLVRERGGGATGMPYVAEALLKSGDLKEALAVALQGNSGAQFVLRSIARQYGLTGDPKPVLDALKDCSQPEKRMPLIVGLVDGLLERSRATKPNSRPAQR